MSTSAERLAPLRKAKHSVGFSRYWEAMASDAVDENAPWGHGRVFSSQGGKDTTENPEVAELIDAGVSVFASFKSQSEDEVRRRAEYVKSLGVGTKGKGRWYTECHYHEPEDLASSAAGPTAWLERQVRFSAITHGITPATLWAVTFTGEPGLELDAGKEERHVYNFLPPGDYPWLDLIGVDRYVHNVVRRPPLKAWGQILAMCKADWDRPLFIAEFGVEGTAAVRSKYVIDHATYVAALRSTKGNKRILGSTWFHSPIGPQAPTVYDGTRTWAIDKASDQYDLATPAAWRAFALQYPMSGSPA